MQTLCNRNFEKKRVLTSKNILLLSTILAFAGPPGWSADAAFAETVTPQATGAQIDAQQLQAMTAQRNQLEQRASTGAASTAELVQLQLLQSQIAAGHVFTPDETKTQGLQAEHDLLEKRVNSREGRPADAQRLQEVTMEIGLGRPPTPAEVQQMQALAVERDQLQKRANTREAKAGDAQRIQEITTQINLGRAPTAAEAQQIQQMTAARDALQNKADKGSATPAELAQIQVLQKEINNGRPLPPDQAALQKLTAEQGILQQRVSSGQATRAEADQLLDVTSKIAVATTPNVIGPNTDRPMSIQEMRQLAADRDMLQKAASTGKASIIELAELQVIQQELATGKRSSDKSVQILQAERDILQKRINSPEGTRADADRLVSVTARLASLTAPDVIGPNTDRPMSIREMRQLAADRDMLQKQASTGRASIIELAELQVIQRELAVGKRSSDRRVQIMQAEIDILQKRAKSRDARPDDVKALADLTARLEQMKTGTSSTVAIDPHALKEITQTRDRLDKLAKDGRATPAQLAELQMLQSAIDTGRVQRNPKDEEVSLLTTERDILQKRINSREGKPADVKRLADVNAQLENVTTGTSSTVKVDPHALKEITQTRDRLDKLAKNGRATPAQLAELQMLQSAIDTGRVQRNPKDQEVSLLTTEREILQKRMNSRGGSPADAKRLADVNAQIQKLSTGGNPTTPTDPCKAAPCTTASGKPITATTKATTAGATTAATQPIAATPNVAAGTQNQLETIKRNAATQVKVQDTTTQVKVQNSANAKTKALEANIKTKPVETVSKTKAVDLTNKSAVIQQQQQKLTAQQQQQQKMMQRNTSAMDKLNAMQQKNNALGAVKSH